MDRLTYLRQKAAGLPLCPGVYLMKNSSGEIIYVGKSKKLKNRVGSYFVNTNHGIKTDVMVSHVADFETILCDSEIEALTLENILIKKHTPKYNINLKDAKSYPYIKIADEPFPRISFSRDRKNDRAFYYGPYQSASVAHAAIETVNRAFSLPTCKRKFPRDIGKERPCIYAQMHRCIAPCTGNISEEEYSKIIASAKSILTGDIHSTVKALETQMLAYANEEKFEEAGRVRDTIRSLAALKEKQKIILDTDSTRDIWACFSNDLCHVLSTLAVRDGAISSKNDFLFGGGEIFDSESITLFLYNHYTQNPPPHEILLGFELESGDLELLSEYLKDIAGKKCEIKTPKIGKLRHVCEMAEKNAKEAAEKHVAAQEKSDKTLIELAKLLQLEVIPERVEAYDISNLGSEHITAGMIVYSNGKFLKSDYRQFKIKSADGKPDDYLSMREALSRRLAHLSDGTGSSLSSTPDLILIDGGVGHIGVVNDVMREMNITIPAFGMVKDDFHKTRALTDGENEINIALHNSVFHLIYKIQEEVHRYTVGAMQNAKRKTLKHSELENISGIGKTKAKYLLSRFGSVKRIAELDESALTGEKITAADAHAIAEYFKKRKGDTNL